MGVIEEPCYDLAKRMKKKRNLSSINIPKEKTDNLDLTTNNHRINIHIKKTWKKSAINKKAFLNGDITIEKNTNYTKQKSHKLMDSFSIFNTQSPIQSPLMTPQLTKNTNFTSFSPIKKYKISNSIKYKYIRGNLIGQGRFGKIYEGLCKLNAEIVTLKVYHNISEDKIKAIMRKKEEIYELNHPNIVKTTLLYKENGQLNAVFDCRNVSSVKEYLEVYGKFDESMIQKYTKQLLQGLKYLHERNIYHKNLKLNNILVDDGNIKISDCFIDGIILGSAKEIYNNLLHSSDSKGNIETYIPPFFIQNIFYFGGSLQNNKEENSKDWEAESKKYFVDWQSFDLWYMGCVLIEICSGEKPWSFYKFKDNREFFEFLKNNQTIPIIPKKLSSELKELLSILLNPTLTNKKNIYDIIFNLPFFKKNVSEFNYQVNNTKSIIQTSFKKDKKIFEDSSIFADSNIQLGQCLQNNKVKNILNPNNNASFSVTNTSSMDDISFSNSYMSNNFNMNLFGSVKSHSKNEMKNYLDGKLNKIKSIKTIKTDMSAVKEVQAE